MKWLIVSDVFPPRCGGVGWGAFYLAKALQKRGHDVTVVTVFGESDHVDGLRVIRVPPRLHKEFAHVTLRRRLKRLIKEEGYDILNAHHVIAVRAAAGLEIPVCATINDYWPLDFRGTLFQRKDKRNLSRLGWLDCWRCIYSENGWGLKILSPLLTVYMQLRTSRSLTSLRQVDAVSFLSRHNLELMSPLVKGIPQTITYHICVPPQGGPLMERAEKPLILFVGKFNVNKGALLVLDIAKVVPEIDVVMVGGTAEDLGVAVPPNVRIIPYVGQQEVYAYMGKAHMFIAPAMWHEPFGRIVVEAMAMGAVPIVSARGGMRSDIVKTGVNGIIADDLTAEGFAKEIRSLFADRRRLSDLSDAARSDFARRFNEDVIVAQFIDLAGKARGHYSQKSLR